jgi:hypothetical protein
MPYYVETGRSRPLIAWFTDNFIIQSTICNATRDYFKCFFFAPQFSNVAQVVINQP